MMTVREEQLPSEEEFFSELLPRNEPVVFRGAVAGWSLARATSDEPSMFLDHVTRVIGHRTVPVSIGLPGDRGSVSYDSFDESIGIPNTLVGNRLFRDVAREMKTELQSKTGHFLYVQSVDVAKDLPELLPLLDFPLSKSPRFKSGHWRFWIGSGNHHVHTHYDRFHNFYSVLVGSKRFTVFPPEVLPDMYVGPLEGGPYGTPASMVNLYAPDLVKYPRFARALEKAGCVELHPGDVFYLPANWWHHVQSNGLNGAANYWWTDLDEHSLKEANATFLRALLSIRPLPQHWRSFWKTFMDYFVHMVDGDPYAHLSIENQGFAGHPTPERLDYIRLLLADHATGESGRAENDEVLFEQKYRLSPSVVLRIASRETLVLNDWATNVDHDIPAITMTVLLQFSSSNTIRNAMAALRDDGWDVDKAELIEIARDLVAHRILLPVE